MNLPIKVKVTDEDIDKGVRHDCDWCPVARAVKRALYGKPGDALIPDGPVKVNKFRIEIDGGRMVAPPSVLKFVEDFDSEEAVSPFEFEIS